MLEVSVHGVYNYFRSSYSPQDVQGREGTLFPRIVLYALIYEEL